MQIKEDLLYYLWQYKLFNLQGLTTQDNQNLVLLHCGTRNPDAGPDFFNGKIILDGQLWAGNIEIHVKSSDWYHHYHHLDSSYGNLILHVVWEHDADVYDNRGQIIPTLTLSRITDPRMLVQYQHLMRKGIHFIPCEKAISKVDPFVLDHWLERLFVERLEEKSMGIQELLLKGRNDQEAVLFLLLARNFGSKVNGEAFLNMATSIPLKVVRKVHFDWANLEALFFGQAGLLNPPTHSPYAQALKVKYDFIRHKYQLQASELQPVFFRLRPSNFPTVRLAQLASLYHHRSNLFSELMQFQTLQAFYDYFDVPCSGFWNDHYSFKTESPKSSKRIGKKFVDLILINTIIPLKFIHQKMQGKEDLGALFNLANQIQSENNSIIDQFREIGVSRPGAQGSQALLQLKNNYCKAKRCLDCSVGNYLLRSST